VGNSPFNQNSSPNNHKLLRSSVEQLEKYVIQAFQNSGKNIMNKAITKPVGICQYPAILAYIKSEFQLI
jgi:hypothetical protein